MTDDKLRALSDFEAGPDLSDIEKLVLRLAVGMTVTPGAVTDNCFDQLKQHFSEPQIVELITSIAWENFRARFDCALGVEAEGFSEGAYCPMPATTTGSK